MPVELRTRQIQQGQKATLTKRLVGTAHESLEIDQQALKREHAYAESLLWAHLLHGEQQKLKHALSVQEARISNSIALDRECVESLRHRVESLQSQVIEFQIGPETNLQKDDIPQNIQSLIDYQLDQLKELTKFCVDWRDLALRKERELGDDVGRVKAQINELMVKRAKQTPQPSEHLPYSRSACQEEPSGPPVLDIQGHRSLEEYMQYGAELTAHYFRKQETNWTRAFIEGLSEENLRNEISEALDYSGWTWPNALCQLGYPTGTMQRETRSKKKKRLT